MLGPCQVSTAFNLNRSALWGCDHCRRSWTGLKTHQEKIGSGSLAVQLAVEASEMKLGVCGKNDPDMFMHLESRLDRYIGKHSCHLSFIILPTVKDCGLKPGYDGTLPYLESRSLCG